MHQRVTVAPNGHHFLLLHLTYESSVGLEAHGSALPHAAGRGQSRGLAVVLEVGQPGSETHKMRTNTNAKQEISLLVWQRGRGVGLEVKSGLGRAL